MLKALPTHIIAVIIGIAIGIGWNGVYEFRGQGDWTLFRCNRFTGHVEQRMIDGTWSGDYTNKKHEQYK